MAYDEIMDFPNHFKDYFHPEKLHQINVSFAVSSLAKHLGGCATNISYALSNTNTYYAQNPKPSTLNSKQMKLNSKKDKKDFGPSTLDFRLNIYPIGAVGRDGGELISFFKNNKINTSHVYKDEKLYTATGKVITDMNDNQIWGFYYGACSINPKLETLNPNQINQNSKQKGNYRLDPGLRRDDTGVTVYPEFWILSATHEKPFTSTLRHVMKYKLPYLFDPGMTLTWIRDDLLKKGVLNATYVIGNDYEIGMIEKRLKMSVKDIVKSGVNVITTLGERGVKIQLRPAEISLNQLKSDEIKIKAVRLRKVVDPTGAGDAWRGGFMGALTAGRSIKECLIMGNVMASFAVEGVGTVEYKASKEEIERRIKTLNPKS
jgi:adenosine kinase